MNGRQKIESAFSLGGTPQIPAVICYEGIYFRDHWTALTSLPWWYAQSPDLDQQKAWRMNLIPSTRQDWMEMPDSDSLSFRKENYIQERSDGIFLKNYLTGKSERLEQPQVGGWENFLQGYSGHPIKIPRTRDEIDFLLPSGNQNDLLRFREEGRSALAEWQLAAFPDLFPIRHVSSPFWACYSLWGFDGLMELVAKNPQLVHYACEKFLSLAFNQITQAVELGASGIWIEECLTDLISPSDFLALNLPYLRQLIDAIHSYGLFSIYYYCGSPAGRLELLLSAGADALSLEESKKGFRIDIDQIAEVVQGRCALLGNLDAICLLSNASEAELRSEIQRQIAAGRKNRSRFMMSLGSPVTPGTSPERVQLYCDLVHAEGVKG